MTRILMAEATDFQATAQVGSHALAREFAKSGAEVCWVGTPLLMMRRPKDDQTRRRIQVWKSGGVRVEERITEYYPRTFLPVVDKPILRTRLAASHTLTATSPPLRGVLKRLGFSKPDVLWLSNSRFSHALPKLVRARVTACRISDDWEHFGTVPPALIALHDEMVDNCDLVFVTSRRLQQKLAARRPDAIYLPNAVADFFFAKPAAEPSMLAKYPRPRVVFVGKLDAWVDFDAIARVAERNPDASVLVVGPGTPAARSYPKNVHFTGPFPYRELPWLLGFCDVGMVPFIKNELTHAVSPLKLFEYLACGLATVATRLDEIEACKPPVTLCDTADEMAAAVTAQVFNKGSHGMRIAYARENTWSKRFDTVQEALRARGVM
jgi:glycosyltransferase involved in cell wall biosynthesis